MRGGIASSRTGDTRPAVALLVFRAGDVASAAVVGIVEVVDAFVTAARTAYPGDAVDGVASHARSTAEDLTGRATTWVERVGRAFVACGVARRLRGWRTIESEASHEQLGSGATTRSACDERTIE